MENENENLDSQNEEISETEIVEDTVPKEKYNNIVEKNRQLFARTKKAEGFELKDGKWVKVEKPPNEEPKKPLPEKSSNVDYGHLGFHNSKSDSVKIEHEEDMEHLRKTMEETGKTQNYLLNAKWFISEIKERQEARVTKEAIPSGSPRSVSTTKDKVEYWLSKPFNEVPEDMRVAVLNERVKAEKEGAKFSPNPVV